MLRGVVVSGKERLGFGVSLWPWASHCILKPQFSDPQGVGLGGTSEVLSSSKGQRGSQAGVLGQQRLCES